MSFRRLAHWVGVLCASLLVAPSARAEEPASSAEPTHVAPWPDGLAPGPAPPSSGSPVVLDPACCWRLAAYGDLRLRYENDWDSRNPAGVLRDDRQRLRTRVRAGLALERGDRWKFDARARTGDRSSQQSPHLTFWDLDGGEEDSLFAGFDRYYARYKSHRYTFWAGRHDLPLWKQNEMLWDDDVTVLGVSAQGVWKCGCETWTATATGAKLPDGQWKYHGTLAAAQVKYDRDMGRWGLIAAAALQAIRGESGPSYLLDGNGGRDYLIASIGLQARTKVGRRPLKFGVDAYQNLEDYDGGSSDAFASVRRQQRTGLVASVTLGEVKKACDWSIGYSFAWIEALAINASYAQDDWVRWGSNGQTQSSDLRGHEVNVAYGVTDRISLNARLFVVESPTSRQDGNRFRLDVNVKL